ncbi:hypothetical protein [Haliangium sp.]|uniref:hypothetical protein n=1 Tax=Haliangium sp. TaxID=2663208 RepID=UPI003D1286E9
MPHREDIEPGSGPAREGGSEHLVMDLLYGELAEPERTRAEEAVRADEDLSNSLGAFSELRALLRELPEEEPPPAVSAKIMHAAAQAVGAGSARARADRPSLWARLERLFMPIATHPGLAAAASLVLVVGIAGVLLLSGRNPVSEAELAPSAQEPADNAAVPAAAPAAPAPGGDVERAEAEPAQQLGERGGAEEQREVLDGLGRGGLSAEVEEVPQAVSTGRAEAPPPAKQRKSRARRASGRRDSSGGDFAKGGYDKSPDTADLEGRMGQSRGATVAPKRATKPVDRRSMPGTGATSKSPSAPTDESAAPAEKPSSSTEDPADAKLDRDADDVAEAEDDGDGDADDGGAPAREQRQARDEDGAGSARALHKRAIDAAARGDCRTVLALSQRVREIDSEYHREVMSTDARLRRCGTDTERSRRKR